MPFLSLLELCVGLLVLILVLSQIIVPLIAGTPLFPLFGRRIKAVTKLEDAEDQLETKVIDLKTEWIKKQIKKLK